jgi:hypothetical protein
MYNFIRSPLNILPVRKGSVAKLNWETLACKLKIWAKPVDHPGPDYHSFVDTLLMFYI